MLKRKKYLILFLLLMFFYTVYPKETFALFQLSKSIEGSIEVLEDNYCINNGFNTLAECMLIMDNYQKTVDLSKQAITNKETPDFSKIAPSILYVETRTDSAINLSLSTSNYYVIGDSYSFNADTGAFTIGPNSSQRYNTSHGTDYTGKYTCGNTSATCNTMYKIENNSWSSSRYSITSGIKYTYKLVEVVDSGNGLYSTSDDYGISYYYRGNVVNNYVYYAGVYWRIIRQNGDGSIRLMYFGDNINKGNNYTSSVFNSKNSDPTYEGYMYDDSTFNTIEKLSNATYFDYFNENTTYYFSNGYTYDTASKTFKLSGTVADGGQISGKWKDIHEKVVSGKYLYTCFGTSETTGCPVLKKIYIENGFNPYLNATGARLRYISFSSTSYENAVNNKYDSAIKDTVDGFYESIIKDKTDSNGKLYSDYLSDNIFCNDRSIDNPSNTGNGFDFVPTTIYGPFYRLYSKKTPQLTCNQKNDAFTVNDVSKGNGALTYPVGLVTADEVALAGGVYNVINSKYYINYNNNEGLWTMSASRFLSNHGFSRVWSVGITGNLNHWDLSTYTFGVRPVVNLSADVLITGGDGTSINPYIVTLR